MGVCDHPSDDLYPGHEGIRCGACESVLGPHEYSRMQDSVSKYLIPPK